MKHALAPALLLAFALAGCNNDQPDEALPPEGELEGALSADDAISEEAIGDEPELETLGEPETSTMESGANPPGTSEPPANSKLQRADPDY